MSSATSISTPADANSKLTCFGGPFADLKHYRQVVGSLQYATITLLDITFEVNRVCQYMHAPTTLHWQAVKGSCVIYKALSLFACTSLQLTKPLFYPFWMLHGYLMLMIVDHNMYFLYIIAKIS